MISRINGRVEEISENALTLAVGGVSYEVLLPAAVLKGLAGLAKDTELSLYTYHYYQTDPSKSIPVLIGFSNPIEKDFFEKFITVSGVGPKAAVRALSVPIPDIAQAIDQGDLAFLKSLPGIGEQRGKEIIAKLQGKMGKFGLMKASAVRAERPDTGGGESAVREEAAAILLQLQYKKEEARAMVDKAFRRAPDLATSEEVLNEVYRQRKETKEPNETGTGKDRVRAPRAR